MLDEFIKVKSHFYERQRREQEKSRYQEKSTHIMPHCHNKIHHREEAGNMGKPSLRLPQIKHSRLSKALKNIMEIAHKEAFPIFAA